MWHDVLSKLLIAAATHDIGSMVVGAEIAHHSWDHYKRKLTDEHMAKGGKYADWPICKYMGLDKSSMETIGVLGLGFSLSRLPGSAMVKWGLALGASGAHGEMARLMKKYNFNISHKWQSRLMRLQLSNMCFFTVYSLAWCAIIYMAVDLKRKLSKKEIQ